MSNIDIENLSFAYENGNDLILKDISTHIDSGEFVCILGQSGCGKSTMLRLLAGLENPTEGAIFIDGKEINGTSLSRGVVFQDYGLYPWMTAGENIMLALTQCFPKKSKIELKEVAVDMIESVGLKKEVYDKFPKELSGGMQQRCAIAQSLSTNPPIMLMDEPFGALDAVTRARLQDLIKSLWAKDENKKTIFFVTHDVDEAILLGNRILVLGQSPSHIIFDYKAKKDKVLSRDNQFDDVDALKLRNELIKQINKDVNNKIK
ncbi:ABC transporter ATP-binding protein [Lagierella massiliensis]|uniref:ABC transporter ATP-binding protein n=1 Tax=Lagierella massiliensis TaxID=1689303 RepID=UPI0006D842A5|nr:ABC transporter ATP-binding protein [Lagierella massiliensis]